MPLCRRLVVLDVCSSNQLLGVSEQNYESATEWCVQVVPLQMRLLYTSAAGVVWGTFLSQIQARPLDSTETVSTPIDCLFDGLKAASGGAVDLDNVSSMRVHYTLITDTDLFLAAQECISRYHRGMGLCDFEQLSGQSKAGGYSMGVSRDRHHRRCPL